MIICTMMTGALLAPTVTYAQFGSLKGLTKKVKEKAKETVGDTGESLGAATSEVTATTRGTAPWTMQGQQVYKGKDLRAFLYNIADESDEYLTELRQQMDSRFKSNAKLLSNYGPGSDVAQMENQQFERFYYEILTLVNSNVSNVQLSANGAIDSSDGRYLITNRKGSGIGFFVMNKGGKFLFVSAKDDGSFLDDEDAAIAKDAAARMRKLQIMTKGLHEVYESAGVDCDRYIRALYNYCGIYANAVEEACANNSPENIERKDRPAAGAMHASLKAQALQVAKAADPDVVDVIITSAAWDVKMKGAIPVNRNVYGYYVVKDAQGLMCVSRMWTEDYIGNGKYGKMRAGGVGVSSPFYIK